MSEELPSNGWNMAAQMLVYNGLSLPDARDLVIGLFLRSGDMRPFSDWVLRGHAPCKRVLECIALMSCETVASETANALPFALVRKKRGGGKKNSRPDPEVEICHARLFEMVRDTGGSVRGNYEAAIATVVDLLGDKKKHQTNRDTYDARHPTKTKRLGRLR
jgi:hypothetical protein